MSGLRPFLPQALGALALAALSGLHALLHGWMLESQVAAKLFAAGPHLTPTDVAGALAFLAARLALYVLGPGWALYLVLSAARAAVRRRVRASD